MEGNLGIEVSNGLAGFRGCSFSEKAGDGYFSFVKTLSPPRPTTYTYYPCKQTRTINRAVS